MSKVQIVNKALTYLGANRITSLSDETLEAQSASNMYEDSLRSILSECCWKFATKRVLLNKLNEEPAYIENGMAHYFQLPSDLVEIFGVMNDEAVWDREAKKIISNQSEFGIKYVYFCDDTTLYPSYFVDAFAIKLAADMCYELTNSEAKTEALLELYKGEFLPLARTKNAREASSPQIKDGHWVTSVVGAIYG